MLNNIIKDKKIACKIEKIPYNDSKAINLAVQYDIDDLPAFVIGKRVFKGKHIARDSIIEAFKANKWIKPSLS